ncbi:hypothetical protein LOZ57_000388 [Ophidiomyces ophidiicola]|uniref:uncharacterized protein n=1 Tax=Ophidiomyces ophidiicola TaxID=1387563 RepID=UPI0020C2883A|nr:uncharacterized protein LOZ57_000388 [Ophidiomyces ophidiicola]KAI1954043.1 hypothetical protein LOZ57_000388 [Ophidiomyces ophidiicola]KAI2049937.1 hypothetical protein LOZ43_005022 [Ophidiomyces ophidiicola]
MLSSSRIPGTYPTTGFELIENPKLLDEETLPSYYPEKYYPAHLGEILGERYQILGKLGFGTTSTWKTFPTKFRTDAYVALKLYVTGAKRDRELNMYKRIEAACAETDHPGRPFIRKLLHSFQVKGPHGDHLCLVHEPLGLNLSQISDYYPGRKLDLEIIRPSLRNILIGLDFLHIIAGIIHTDLQTTNLIFSVSRPEILAAFEDQQASDPVPRKILDDGRTIYSTRPLNLCNGLPLLCDFGEARTFEEAGTPGEDVMPDVYKAPEVILQMKWDHQIDIWNVAMVVWHLLMGEPLFKGRSPCGTYQDDRVHMAEMVALMGNPPLEFTQRSHMSRALWDETGKWKGAAPIPDISLEKLGANIIGDDEDKEGFLEYFRKMLCWVPEERPNCEELVLDPWLMKGLNIQKPIVRTR